MNDIFEAMVAVMRENARAGIFPSHLADAELAPETRLVELGIDSLGKMALLTSLMDLTDKYLPDNAFDDHDTLLDIARIAQTA